MKLNRRRYHRCLVIRDNGITKLEEKKYVLKVKDSLKDLGQVTYVAGVYSGTDEVRMTFGTPTTFVRQTIEGSPFLRSLIDGGFLEAQEVKL